MSIKTTAKHDASHKAYSPDNCPLCGTAAKIPTASPIAPAKKAAAKKAAPAKGEVQPIRVSADGKTVLQVGMTVTSEKDGLTGEVSGYDRSDLYVKVKFADGNVRARSARTLLPVKARTRKGAAKK
jgi:hypothetical protein